jgi:hypothetical protein
MYVYREERTRRPGACPRARGVTMNQYIVSSNQIVIDYYMPIPCTKETNKCAGTVF